MTGVRSTSVRGRSGIIGDAAHGAHDIRVDGGADLGMREGIGAGDSLIARLRLGVVGETAWGPRSPESVIKVCCETAAVTRGVIGPVSSVMK